MTFHEIGLFKGISSDTVDAIANAAIEESHSEGTVLFKKGDSADSFYILQQGQMEIAIDEEGNVTFMLKNSGDVFGWSSLLEHPTRTTSARCTASCKLIKLDKAKLVETLKKNPEDAALFFKNLGGIIAQQLSNAYSLLLICASDKTVTFPL